MKILIAIIDTAVLLMIVVWLYLKYSLRAMVKWEDELVAEQKAAKNIPIYYDDHDVSGLIDED